MVEVLPDMVEELGLPEMVGHLSKSVIDEGVVPAGAPLRILAVGVDVDRLHEDLLDVAARIETGVERHRCASAAQTAHGGSACSSPSDDAGRGAAKELAGLLRDVAHRGSIAARRRARATIGARASTWNAV